MAYVRKTGEKGRYWMRDRSCIGARCFAPGEFQTMGAAGTSGLRSTGKTSLCCMRNAHHGCPDDPEHSKDLERERKAEGWKNA